MSIDFSSLPVRVVVGDCDTLISGCVPATSTVIYALKDNNKELSADYLSGLIIECVSQSVNVYDAPPGGVKRGRLSIPETVDLCSLGHWTTEELDRLYVAGINPIRYITARMHNVPGLYIWGQVFWTADGQLQRIYNESQYQKGISEEFLRLLPVGAIQTVSSSTELASDTEPMLDLEDFKGRIVDLIGLLKERTMPKLRSLQARIDDCQRYEDALKSLRTMQGEILPGRNDEYVPISWVLGVVNDALNPPPALTTLKSKVKRNRP
jgi:hypothetical protein